MESQKQELMQFIWCSSIHIRGIFKWRKLCFTSLIYIFSHFFSIRNIFFSNTLRLSLNFNNIRKLKHVITWETLCNRNFAIKFIKRFQVNAWYTMRERPRSKYTCPLYLRPLSSLTAINPLELPAMVKYCIYLQLLWKCYKGFP